MIEYEKILLLYCLLVDIRGNWGWKVSERIQKIKDLCLDEEIKTVSKDLLKAIYNNALEFDGEFNDGRIFRDGKMTMPEEIIKQYNFPKEMKNGVSGNLAMLFGAVSKKIGKYCGTYGELKVYIKFPITYLDKSEEFKQEALLLTYPEFEDITFDELKNY